MPFGFTTPAIRRLALSSALVMLAGLTLVASAAQAEPPPLSDPGQVWQPTFGDEFDGPVVDPLKWSTCYWWVSLGGCTNSNNGELQWYKPGNAVVEDGVLKLRAKREQTLAPDGKTYAYTSGMVSTGRATNLLNTAPRYDFTYGYAEIRAWLPKGKGLWPAFWLLPSSHTWPPELDVMENIGSDPNTVSMGTHYRNATGGTSNYARAFTGPDFSAGWHTVGLDWQPDLLVWYIDGKVQHWTTDPAHIPDEPMYLLANLAVGGQWPGAPDSSTAFPSEFLVDYIRVWQRKAATVTQPPPPPPPPTVRLTAPVSGATVTRGKVVPLAAEASGAAGIANVTFSVDGQAICTDTTAPYGCNWTVRSAKGSHTVTAKVQDAAGATATSSASVRVR